MKIIILITFIISSFLYAQEIKDQFKTGDNDVDQYLSEVNGYGTAQYDFFKRNLSMKFGIDLRDVDRYVYKENIRPADLYYACTIASVTHRNVADVILLYQDKKGWGAVAKELGIKPGSREFHKLKSKSMSGIGKIKSKNMEGYRGSKNKKK